ncbi:MAG TPA: glycosyltransferase family 25 protein [Verrucomicrobiales bacterium]|nr:glycosyltransferase family 25 protein [Verrucomicrobiales bacterium]
MTITIQYEAFEFNAFIVSLARSTERRKAMERSAGAAGIPWAWWDAVDGSDPSFSPETYHGAVLSGRYLDDPSLVRQKGTIGCTLSHYLLWRRLGEEVNTGRRDPSLPVLVLEDDVEMHAQFRQLLPLAFTDLPGDFDLLMLTGWPGDLRCYWGQQRAGRNLLRLRNFCVHTTAAYFINTARIDRILGVMLPFVTEIDIDIASRRQRLGLYMAATSPPLCRAQVSTASARLEVDYQAQIAAHAGLTGKSGP